MTDIEEMTWQRYAQFDKPIDATHPDVIPKEAADAIAKAMRAKPFELRISKLRVSEAQVERLWRSADENVRQAEAIRNELHELMLELGEAALDDETDTPK